MKTYLGFATGAVDFNNPAKGLLLFTRMGVQAVELTALHEEELSAVEALYALQGLTSQVSRLSVHAPAHGISSSEEELVQRLSRFSCPITVHASTLLNPRAWRPLANRLQIENTEFTASFGNTPKDLFQLFEAIPQARLCLDIPHAVRTGGVPLLLEFADTFADRLTQIHIGCPEGAAPNPELEPDLLLQLELVLARLSSAVAVISERKMPADPDHLFCQLGKLAKAAENQRYRASSVGCASRHSLVQVAQT
jgi:hypothetical protein